VQVRRTARRPQCRVTVGDRWLESADPEEPLSASGHITYHLGDESATVEYELQPKELGWIPSPR
jgi:hypothetical protein